MKYGTVLTYAYVRVYIESNAHVFIYLLLAIGSRYAMGVDRQTDFDVENDLLRRSPLSELLLSMLKSNGMSCASL